MTDTETIAAEDQISEVSGEVWPYRFEILSLDNMYLDKYQRPLNEAWLKKEGARFDPSLLGVLTVSEREKKGIDYALVDGQHRKELVERRGLAELPCVVFYNLTLEQESALFSKFQRQRRSITPFQRFNSDLIAKDPTALNVARVLASEKFQMAEKEGAGMIKAVVAVERIYADDPQRLRLTLRLIRETWGDTPYARNESILKGVAAFLAENPEVDENRFIERLRNTTPSALTQRAHQLREARGLKGSAGKFIAEAIDIDYRRRGAKH